MLEDIQTYAYIILVGFVPSLIWLFYFLSKDPHKEPKRVILQVFILGMMSTLIAVFLEFLYVKFLFEAGLKCVDCDDFAPDFLSSPDLKTFGIISFVVIMGLAFIEELIKYLIVKIKIIKSVFFDEPVDAMIYLIVGALGFAALENIGYMLSDIENAIQVIYFRFFTATFLHVLASAIVGYFFALSIIHKKSHLLYISIGLFIATILHGSFNLIIMHTQDNAFSLIYLALLLIFMYNAVSYLFKRIKKIHYNMQNQ